MLVPTHRSHRAQTTISVGREKAPHPCREPRLPHGASECGPLGDAPAVPSTASCLDLTLAPRLLLGLQLDRAGGPLGFARFRLTLLLERLRLPAHPLVKTPALHLRVEHFQGSAAGVYLVVMGEIGEAFENAEQLLVPGGPPDLHIAGAALRAERPKARQLVATLGGRCHGAAVERAHEMQRLTFAGLPRILAEPDADGLAVLLGSVAQQALDITRIGPHSHHIQQVVAT